MSVVRKGLALRNVVVEKTKMTSPIIQKKEQRKAFSNSSLKKETSKPQYSERLPFPIYQDPAAPRCQHCGLEKSQSAKNNTQGSISIGVQANLDGADLDSLLCSGDPPKEYWESLAEQRRVALKETLDENMELCSLVEKLNAEIERLSKIAEHTERFSNTYQMIRDESLPTTNTTTTTKRPAKPRRSL